MDLMELKADLSKTHAEVPQRHGLAMMYWGELQGALHGLASLGHALRVEKDSAPPVVQFPMVLYNGKDPSITAEVSSSEAEAQLKSEGWVEHPSGKTEEERAKEEEAREAPVRSTLGKAVDYLHTDVKPAVPPAPVVAAPPVVRPVVPPPSVPSPSPLPFPPKESA